MPNPYQEIMYCCAVCGKRRGDANHWLIAQATSGRFSLFLWDDRLARRAVSMPLCGQACATQAQDTFLSKVYASQPKVKAIS